MDQVTQQLEAILQTANQSTLQQEMRGEYQGGMMENRGPSHTIEKTQVAPCS